MLQRGDRLVVTELSRLGRSLGQIVTILDALAKDGVAFVALKENIRVEGKLVAGNLVGTLSLGRGRWRKRQTKRFRSRAERSAMLGKDSFSRRNQYVGEAKDIAVREGAPEKLRATVLHAGVERGFGPKQLRKVICRVLRERPDPENWTDYPNVWDEVQWHMYNCEWFRVYDIIEALYAVLQQSDDETAAGFAGEINTCFVEEGIGWQLVDGQVLTRGTEAFESVVKTATEALGDSSRPTASSHLRQAFQDLSRRPEADCGGAIYHAMGALEAVARDVAGTRKPTLGEVIKRNEHLFPKPLNTAFAKLWGYTSDSARHVAEGHEPSREEAELVVGLAAAMATYLTRFKRHGG